MYRPTIAVRKYIRYHGAYVIPVQNCLPIVVPPINTYVERREDAVDDRIIIDTDRSI